MSLQNLVGISLDAIAPSRETVARLRSAAKRQITDAQVAGVSAETRFASAYTAIRMLADLALNAHGYRTLTSRPGHHQTAIQTLPLTVGVASQTVQVLDALRKQRHLTEYSGDLIPESATVECVAQAKALQTWVANWLKTHKPELM